MSEANKALARQLWDVWHSRDLDKLGDLIAEGHVNHDPNNPADLVGVEGLGRSEALPGRAASKPREQQNSQKSKSEHTVSPIRK